MKILLEITQAIRNHRGWGRYTRELCTHLLKLDSENQYVLFYHQSNDTAAHARQLREELGYPNVSFHPIALSRAEYDALEEVRNRSFLDETFPDASLYHAVTEFPFHVASIPKITTIHEISPLLYPDLFSADRLDYFFRYIHEAVHTSEALVAVSPNTSRDLRDWFGVGRNRVRTIFNGVSPRFFSNPITEKRRRDRTHVLYVGPTQDPLKGFSILWDAFRNEFSWDLTLVVPESERRIVRERYLSDALAARVTLLSSVSDEDLHHLYQSASVLAFPSLHEGFGLPVAEALAAGLPVVSGAHSGIADYARESVTEFDGVSPGDLVVAVQKAIRASVSDRLRYRAQMESLNWERAARQYLELYEEVARAGRCRPSPVAASGVQAPLISVGGSYSSMGALIARRYPSQIRDSIAYCTRMLFSDFKWVRKLPRTIRTAIARCFGALYWLKFDGATKDFILGMYRESRGQLSLFDLAYINTYPEARVMCRWLARRLQSRRLPDIHCNTLFSRQGTGAQPAVVHGRNLDHDAGEELARCFLPQIFAPNGCLPYAGTGFVGTLNTYTGINQAGLSLSEIGGATWNTRFCRPWAHLFREILEQCQTTDEAAAKIRAHGPYSYSHRFMVVSARGAVPVRLLETGPEGIFEIDTHGARFLLESESPSFASTVDAIVQGKNPEDLRTVLGYWTKRSQSFNRLHRLNRNAQTIDSLKTWLSLTGRDDCVMQTLTENVKLVLHFSPSRVTLDGSPLSARGQGFLCYDLSEYLASLAWEKVIGRPRLKVTFPIAVTSGRELTLSFWGDDTCLQWTSSLGEGKQEATFDVEENALKQCSNFVLSRGNRELRAGLVSEIPGFEILKASPHPAPLSLTALPEFK